MWAVVQTEEFGAWFSRIDAAAQEDVFAAVRILSEIGPSLGRPLVDSLKGSKHTNMKELRVQSKGRPFRIAFAFDRRRQAVLLVGGNKQGQKRFYQDLIRTADDRFENYLRSQGL